MRLEIPNTTSLSAPYFPITDIPRVHDGLELFRIKLSIHGGAETFWTLVLATLSCFSNDTLKMNTPYRSTVPLVTETRLPISYKHLILPEKYPPPTPLLDSLSPHADESWTISRDDGNKGRMYGLLIADEVHLGGCSLSKMHLKSFLTSLEKEVLKRELLGSINFRGLICPTKATFEKLDCPFFFFLPCSFSPKISCSMFPHHGNLLCNSRTMKRSIQPQPPTQIPSSVAFVPADGPAPEPTPDTHEEDDDPPRTLLQILAEHLSLAFLSRLKTDTSDLNRENEVDSFATISAILNRLGADTLPGRMARRTSQYSTITAATAKSDAEGEVWFDWAFVDFWKPNCYTVQRGLSTDPDQLASTSAQRHFSLEDTLRSQPQEIDNCNNKNRLLKKTVPRIAALKSELDSLHAGLQVLEARQKEAEKEQENLLVLWDGATVKRKRDCVQLGRKYLRTRAMKTMNDYLNKKIKAALDVQLVPPVNCSGIKVWKDSFLFFIFTIMTAESVPPNVYFPNASNFEIHGSQFMNVQNMHLNKSSIKHKLQTELKPINGAHLNPDKTCLKGTRVAIIAEILAWIHNPDNEVSKPFFLCGEAGTGKSTISHTIGQNAKDTKCLGAFFCFDRNFSAERTPSKALQTIAYDLSISFPEFGRAWWRYWKLTHIS
ncbi:hypothetical protein BT96DRAFT_1020592 [Gymnopus androsaceus JB14]|uniref:Nephrocystin 3-like N-terminal domain-containing protein n=1 Tax=Gymnopus androsaceus JB14 TaxID=1447944 RepID=A0A6A4HK28_9AGAR|nr:hypothetical protein BT96DRAFT_1020592 [Gymnopus androsaceus JB14]